MRAHAYTYTYHYILTFFTDMGMTKPWSKGLSLIRPSLGMYSCITSVNDCKCMIPVILGNN